MSKKMWNKIFKSKSNKNSKTLQAANKINKRCSIYEEYQQLNVALDLTGQNEKFLENSQANDASTLIKNSLSSSPTPPTKIPQTTTTFTKVVNSLTLKRSQNSNSSKDLKSGNGNETKEKHSKKSEFKTISASSLSSPSIGESTAINQTITIDHNNSSFNTPCDASLNRQQQLTAFTDTIATATSNLNNNNEYLACNNNLANPNFQQQQQQKRLSQIVIVVRKLNTTASLTPTSSSSDLATNLNNQIHTTSIATTNKLNNLNTNISTALENSSLTTASSNVVNDQNQLSVNTKHNFDVSDHYTNLQHDDRRFCFKDLDNSNNIATPTELPPETNDSVKLSPCPICARTFNPVTLRKHVGICEKMATKKRNIFDSSRQRREGTELATYPLPKNFGLPEKTASSTSIAQARGERGHSPKPAQISSPLLTRKKPAEGLIRSTARASMRKVTASTTNTTPTAANATATTPSNFSRDRMRSSERSLTRRGIQPPPAEQCPHCERCFGIKAYDRHVEWCKEKALQASIKQGNTKTDGNVAKARWEARTKYRAPCLKTKRSMNREKYSGLAGDENEPDDVQKYSKTSNNTHDNTLMSMSMTSSITSERNITNPTGNINEPSKTATKTPATVKNYKRTRDKSQTPQPPPTNKTTKTTSNNTTENIQEPIINFEFEMPDLMGGKLAMAGKNKKLRGKTTNAKSISSTVSKLKPQQIITRKSDQKLETTDVKANLPTASLLAQQNTSSNLSVKSIRAIHLKDTHNDDDSNDGNNNDDDLKHEEKVASARNVDLSTSLTFHTSPKKTTKEEVMKPKTMNSSSKLTDNEAKEISAESIKLTMKQYFNKDHIIELKYPKSENPTPAPHKEKLLENSKHIHNIMDDYNPGYADSLDILGSKKFIGLRNDSRHVQSKSVKVIKETSREDTDHENEDLNVCLDNITKDFVNTHKDLIMKQSYCNNIAKNVDDNDEIDNVHHEILTSIPKITIPKSQLRIQSKNRKQLNNKESEILSPAEILAKTQKLIKSKSTDELFKCRDLSRPKLNEISIKKNQRKKEEFSENRNKVTSSRDKTPRKQQQASSIENLSETEIYQDCLIDSDELQLTNFNSALVGSTESLNDSFEAISKSDRGKHIERNANEKYSAIPSSAKSDTFILETDNDKFKYQNEENRYKESIESHPIPEIRNLSPPRRILKSQQQKPKIALPKTYERNDTPRTPKSFRPTGSSTPKPQFPSPPSPSVLPSTPYKVSQNIQTRLETSSIKSLSICRSKRKKALRQTVSCTSTLPMKAIPIFKESIPQIKPVNSGNEQFMNSYEQNDSEEENAEEEEDMIGECDEGGMKNTCTIMDKEIKVIKEPPQLKRNKSFTVSGLPDNYDPFLSAKRQLEELCSPTTSDSVAITQTAPQTPRLPSLPATPNLNKMSTSLILSSSTPNTTPSPMTTSQIPQQTTPKTPTMVRSSSFRRTASLRGPRRSPLLSTRPPLFAQKQRPTIQRGLSDEGPISTNFLKPEEYDEMPVRSVCGNDFAITNSPRVVRRDTTASNRKQQPTLKLNINAANASGGTSATVTPNITEPDIVPINTAPKYASKTDSLAVFLKYEHELEKINSSGVGQEYKKEHLDDIKEPTPSSPSEITTPLTNLDGPLNAKELKDKSNNLSKQNSAKNIKADILDLAESQENNDYALNTTSTNAKLTTEMECSNYGQVRLQPLGSKPTTPLTKPSTPLTKPSTPLTNPTTPTTAVIKPCTPQLPPTLTPLNVKNLQQPQEPAKTPKSPKPVALSSIFSGDRPTKQPTHSSLLYGERKNSLGSDYIDPKLINKCDNLPINLNLKRSDFKHSDSDTSEPRMEHFSSSSSESSAPAKKSTSLTQNSKFLPLVKQQQQEQPNNSNNLNQNHSLHQHNAPSISNSQRNSAEGRNLLKRRMRLGRNQFLYDASPEGDSCSADDEANRSSMECDNHNFMKEHEKTFERLTAAQMNPIDAPFIPPLPAFDDFDFEEFLSSFKNDEEQFPIFKDCREFLLNRTSKKQRSMLLTNSNPLSKNNNSTNFNKSSPQTFPPLTPQAQSTPTQQHFQFPSLPQHPKNLFNSFTLNTRARNKYDDLANTKSTDTFVLANSNGEDQKREIFISIETEQNDLDKSPISPNSIRNIVGNPQTVVEVEVDTAHDNKFSKISDDDADCAENSEVLKSSMSRSTNFPGHLPNVQLNNAKNLIQQMQEDFRQMGEEMNANIRQTIEHRTPQSAQPDMNLNSSPMAASRSIRKVNKSTGTPSGDAYADSDELSSLDGYPLSSPNSRLGVSSKTSADSAYGSLSRQRSSELSSQRSSNRNRPITSSSTANTLFNRPLTEESSLGRSRQLSASSSSSSEHALPPIVANNSFTKHQQQQQQQHLYNNNNNATDLNDMMRYERNNNYDVLHQPVYPSTSAGTATTNSHSNLESSSQLYSSNSTMSTSMKMSRFCHECGGKFLVEQAKFCMDCGVKRIVL